MNNDDMARVLGFGIIGCGTISDWHAGAIGCIPGTKLVGATDVYIKAANDFAARFSCRVFESVEALLACDDVHVVSICTPSGLHAKLAIMAANAGKHIIIEKPMGITAEQLDAIIDACNSNHVKLTVISQFRFYETVQLLKKAVDDGYLGRLYTGDIIMKYNRSKAYYDGSTWRGTKAMDGGGALMNQGIHGVDLLTYIMGPVGSVFARSGTLRHHIEVEDTLSAVLEFKCGAIGLIQGTTSVYHGFPRRLEVCGENGNIFIEEDKILHWDVNGYALPAGFEAGHVRFNSSSTPTNIRPEGHVHQITDLVNAIHADRAPLIDQHEGRKAVDIILAAYKSAETGKAVYLD